MWEHRETSKDGENGAIPIALAPFVSNLRAFRQEIWRRVVSYVLCSKKAGCPLPVWSSSYDSSMKWSCTLKPTQKVEPQHVILIFPMWLLIIYLFVCLLSLDAAHLTMKWLWAAYSSINNILNNNSKVKNIKILGTESKTLKLTTQQIKEPIHKWGGVVIFS